jgi:hypothetical protein
MKEQAIVARPVAAPRMFELFAFRFLELSKPMARRLWAALCDAEAQPLLYSIARAEDKWMHPDYVHRFGDLANPSLLMQLCARLAPETGQPRERAVIEVEEAILSRTSKEGEWL